MGSDGVFTDHVRKLMPVCRRVGKCRATVVEDFAVLQRQRNLKLKERNHDERHIHR